MADFLSTSSELIYPPHSEIRNPKLFDTLNIDFDEGEGKSDDQGAGHEPDQSEGLDSP